MWGTQFKNGTQRIKQVSIEEIVKLTLEKFAESYKMGTNKEDYQETDKYASDFILNTMPKDYDRMLSYYDFKKQETGVKNAECKKNNGI